MTRRAPAIVAAAVAAGGAAVLLVAGRETWFYLDEWDFSLRAADLSADSIMNPNNQNWHGTVVLVYRAMFELFGFGGYPAFRLLATALVVGVAVLAYLYARPRIGAWWALLPLGLLVASPSFEVQLWPFQMGQLLSGAAGLGALLLLDRESTRASLIAAAVLLVVAVASSSAGAPMVALVVYDRLLTSERRRQVLVALPAIVAYGLWYAEYAGREPRPNTVSASSFSAAADKAIEVADGNITALLGLTSQGPKGVLAGQIGLALLVVGVCWRIFGPYSQGRARVVAIAGALVTFWCLLAWGRPYQAGLGVSGRYVFLSQLLVLLLLVELGAGFGAGLRERRAQAARWALGAAVAVVAALAVLHNVRTELDFGGFLRQNARAMEGQVYGLALLPQERRATAPLHLEPIGFQIPRSAGGYFDLFDRFGGPAPTEQDVRALPPDSRGRADQALIMALTTPQADAAAQGGAPPGVTPVGAASTRADGPCVTTRSSGGGKVFIVDPPPGGVEVSNVGSGPLSVQTRRYASDWLGPAWTDVAKGAPLTLRIAPMNGSAPWRLRLAGEAARVCSLAGA